MSHRTLIPAILLLGIASVAGAQQPPPPTPISRITVEPATLRLDAGQTAKVKVVAYDAAGQVIPSPALRIAAPGRSVRIGGNCDATGCEFDVTGTEQGVFAIPFTAAVSTNNATPAAARLDLSVSWPSLARIDIGKPKYRLYPGTTIGLGATAWHADKTKRPNAVFRWVSSNPAVATVDRFGNVTAHKAGAVTISASLEGSKGEIVYTIPTFTASKLEIAAATDQLKTGDVLSLGLRATSAGGQEVTDLPVTWAFTFVPDDSIKAPGAPGQISDEGKFVAEVPGVYTVLASAGPLQARKSVDVRPREAIRPISSLGRGSITNVHTADLWVFEGNNKRDYALVGTWGGDGWSYMFDVTDPTNITKTDSIQIDARTINDVTVSPDARWAVLSREGASNRRNGVVFLDLADPAHPKISANFDEDLTGGVHNMFATRTHLYALSGGDKYIMIDVADMYKPRKVSEYNHPNSRLHDVTVQNGIAYSSEWGTGVVMVDVGNGKWGGTLEKPVFINSYAYPVGATHEVFIQQQRDGRIYAFLGDEIMSRQGAAWAGTNASLTAKGGVPQTMSGYVHIVDVTDPHNPKDVARYEQREFGSHDIWIENGTLYQAYYDGGLRVIDVSGELMGNLAEQGREIAIFKPYDPQGYTANAPMVMNAQPYKGNIFITDFNSGLWSVKLQPKPTKPAT